MHLIPAFIKYYSLFHRLIKRFNLGMFLHKIFLRLLHVCRIHKILLLITLEFPVILTGNKTRSFRNVFHPLNPTILMVVILYDVNSTKLRLM